MTPDAATRPRASRLLESVLDPELPLVSVVDLGIVRDVAESADGRAVTVTLTPTYSGCPAMEVIRADVEAALRPAYDVVDLRMQLSPPWTTEWMTERAREALRAAGIAPPGPRSAVTVGVSIGRRAAAPGECPQCGSGDVEELAEFGSTACKALWRCRACREPFDYMKPH